MSRLIQTEIKAPVAEQILFGSLQSGGTVRIGVEGEKLDLRYSS
jgi:ATP-dependent Clp protease ATP-binding subunit ClpA